MSNRTAAWFKRAAGEVVVFLLGLAVAAALSMVLVPIDLHNGEVGNEARRELYNRLALRQVITLPIWIAAYYTLHRLYCRWRNAPAR